LNTKAFLSDPVFVKIGEAADALGQETYVIGGYVRDCILRRGKPKDIDIVTVGSGIALARAVAQVLGIKKVHTFQNFGTAQLRYRSWEIEFVGARKESYRRDSRKPLVEDGTLEDDQNRRDFTINALALALNAETFGRLLDPFNGLSDLQDQKLRTPLDPEVTFSDDPLRMMRAIRFATQLQFELVPEAHEAIIQKADRLSIISKERISDELHKIMAAPRPSVGIIGLFKAGLLAHILPEVQQLQGVEEIEGQSHKDNFYHTAEVVDNVAARSTHLWLRYAALFHDIGKPVTKKFIPPTGWTFHNHEFVGAKMVYRIFKRLKFPLGETVKYVQKIVRLSSRPIAVNEDTATDSAARRLLFEAGDDLEDLMILAESDLTTRNQRKKKQFLQNFAEVRARLKAVEEKDQVRNFQPPVSGGDIMTYFGIGPGREIGLIKEAIKEAILEGELPNERPAAWNYMIEKGAALGLKKAGEK